MHETGTGQSGAPVHPPLKRPRLLVVGLSVVVLTVAVLQTAVVPVLGVIADQLGASPVAVSWAVTANLLAAAGATPLIGRLADLHRKKRVLLVVLAVVLVGSLLAATTASLALLIVARVLQAARSRCTRSASPSCARNCTPTGWGRPWRCCRARWGSAAAPAWWWSVS